MSKVIQTLATDNQSFATFEQKQVFVFDNRFDSEDFTNVSGSEVTVLLGSFIARVVADGKVTPATAINLLEVIGIVTTVNDIVVPDTNTARINYGISGTINESLLVFPATVDMDTAVGTITFRDHLQGLGFNFSLATENTKFDNQ